MSRLRLRTLAPALLLGAALAGCDNDLDVVNPNARSTENFWQSPADALVATNAVYSALYPLGTYGRWQVFVNDLRSDVGTARTSPWADLANFGAFQVPTYNWEINFETWRDHYRGIAKANQVIANVPGIEMDATLRGRYVGEAKFIRALLYFNLVNLYGGSIPLVLELSQDPTARVGSSTEAAVYAQIEQDLTDAIGVLPATYGGADAGRATQGAARTLLGKVHLQQREWAQAAAALEPVVASGRYSLLPEYGDNFVQRTDNANPESIFEVQHGEESTLAANIPGLSFPRMAGPCGAAWRPTFCDLRPTRWYYEQFLVERGPGNAVDRRLDATIYYNKPTTTERVYGRPYQELFANDPTTAVREDTLIFFRKYGEYYRTEQDFQRWDNPINYKVLRYADVLLMRAEALVQQGQPGPAAQLVNLVRQRAGLAPVGTVTVPDVLRQRLLEFGLEGQRWFDIVRYNFTAPGPTIAELQARDPDFSRWEARSRYLPIPTSETLNNPTVTQPTGW